MDFEEVAAWNGENHRWVSEEDGTVEKNWRRVKSWVSKMKDLD